MIEAGADFASIDLCSLACDTEELEVHSGPPGKEIYTGILHLYRTKKEERKVTDTIAIINIHASLPIKSIVSFLYPYWRTIEKITVLKTKYTNRYATLIKFKSEDNALHCIKVTDGIAINGEESEPLSLVFVKSFTITKNKDEVVAPEDSIEFPSCPICLEKLDEYVNGVITVQCSHSFHRECIYKWNDANCPVCRLDLSPLDSGNQECRECGSTEALWMCLICGYIGCNRYKNKHSYIHFQKTNHVFSKQVGGSKVWDYATDSYVYRIICNEELNKYVQWERIPKATDSIYDNTDLVEAKLDGIEKEYLGILSLQLESQKDHYERTIRNLTTNYQLMIDNLRSEIDRQNDVNDSKVISLEKKILNLKQKNSELSTTVQEEKLLNKCLIENEAKHKEIMESKTNEFRKQEKSYTESIKDLNEQLSDLYSHFSLQCQLEEQTKSTGESFQGATFQVTSKPQKTKSKQILKKSK